MRVTVSRYVDDSINGVGFIAYLKSVEEKLLSSASVLSMISGVSLADMQIGDH